MLTDPSKKTDEFKIENLSTKSSTVQKSESALPELQLALDILLGNNDQTEDKAVFSLHKEKADYIVNGESLWDRKRDFEWESIPSNQTSKISFEDRTLFDSTSIEYIDSGSQRKIRSPIKEIAKRQIQLKQSQQSKRKLEEAITRFLHIEGVPDQDIENPSPKENEALTLQNQIYHLNMDVCKSLQHLLFNHYSLNNLKNFIFEFAPQPEPSLLNYYRKDKCFSFKFFSPIFVVTDATTGKNFELDPNGELISWDKGIHPYPKREICTLEIIAILDLTHFPHAQSASVSLKLVTDYPHLQYIGSLQSPEVISIETRAQVSDLNTQPEIKVDDFRYEKITPIIKEIFTFVSISDEPSRFLNYTMVLFHEAMRVRLLKINGDTTSEFSVLVQMHIKQNPNLDELFSQTKIELAYLFNRIYSKDLIFMLRVFFDDTVNQALQSAIYLQKNAHSKQNDTFPVNYLVLIAIQTIQEALAVAKDANEIIMKGFNNPDLISIKKPKDIPVWYLIFLDDNNLPNQQFELLKLPIVADKITWENLKSKVIQKPTFAKVRNREFISVVKDPKPKTMEPTAHHTVVYIESDKLRQEWRCHLNLKTWRGWSKLTNLTLEIWLGRTPREVANQVIRLYPNIELAAPTQWALLGLDAIGLALSCIAAYKGIKHPNKAPAILRIYNGFVRGSLCLMGLWAAGIQIYSVVYPDQTHVSDLEFYSKIGLAGILSFPPTVVITSLSHQQKQALLSKRGIGPLFWFVDTSLQSLSNFGVLQLFVHNLLGLPANLVNIFAPAAPAFLTALPTHTKIGEPVQVFMNLFMVANLLSLLIKRVAANEEPEALNDWQLGLWTSITTLGLAYALRSARQFVETYIPPKYIYRKKVPYSQDLGQHLPLLVEGDPNSQDVGDAERGSNPPPPMTTGFDLFREQNKLEQINPPKRTNQCGCTLV